MAQHTKARNATEQQMSEGNCPLDDEPIRKHQRCAGCTILIGPKHYMRQSYIVNVKTYCADCAGRIARHARK